MMYSFFVRLFLRLNWLKQNSETYLNYEKVWDYELLHSVHNLIVPHSYPFEVLLVVEGEVSLSAH